jgi:hypothetical protein
VPAVIVGPEQPQVSIPTGPQPGNPPGGGSEFESPHPCCRGPAALCHRGRRPPSSPRIGCASSARSARRSFAIAARLLPDDLAPGD